MWGALERYWKPICEKREGARRRFGTLHLAQAQSNRGRRGRKRDFPDAERLVKRLVARELILSFVPDAEQRLWRTVTRKKYQLRRDRVRLLLNPAKHKRSDFRACIQLSLSCPFRPLHTFHFLRPARLRTPLLGYGAPHLSARGTSTLLNNALLSAHFRIADNPPGISVSLQVEHKQFIGNGHSSAHRLGEPHTSSP